MRKFLFVLVSTVALIIPAVAQYGYQAFPGWPLARLAASSKNFDPLRKSASGLHATPRMKSLPNIYRK